MRQILFIIGVLFPMFAFADIIATKSNGNIEGVTVVSIGADEVTYKQGGVQKTIASSEVEGVLYDDGRFATPPTRSNYSDEHNEVASDEPSWNDETEQVVTGKQATERRQRRERANTKEPSEVGQAFKDAGIAIKDAFSTMFKSMKKDKTTTTDDTDSNNSNADKSTTTTNSDDNW